MPITYDIEKELYELNKLLTEKEEFQLDREYQKEAIKNAVIYLASGRYTKIEDLIAEAQQTPEEEKAEEEENENLIVEKIEEIKNYLIQMPELVDNIHNLLAIVSQKK